ncbi:MAG: hypothetical protein ACTSP5_11960 [Candidatus Heimdallarchaeota archaeon]
MTEKENIPLFLNLIEPLEVVIIDDNLIGFSKQGGIYQYPDRPFQILQQLYKNEGMKKLFPEQLRVIFEDEKKESNVVKIRTFCLIGYLNDGYYKCLQATVSISEDPAYPVVINNFLYNYHYKEFLKLNYEIKLTAVDAFLLFSNLFAIGGILLFDSPALSRPQICFDKQVLKEEIEKAFRNFTSGYAEIRQKTMLFSLEYLDYLLDKMNKKEITPQTILRLSGAPILAFEKLSTNQKVIYTTFLEHIYPNSFSKYIAPFDEKMSKSLKQIKTSLSKPITIDSFK